MLTSSWTCFKCAFLCAGMQLEVVYADGCDHVAFTSGVAGTVRENNLIVSLTIPQQTQVLKEKRGSRRVGKRFYYKLAEL